MNKAILVIDMPDGCRECHLCGEEYMTYRDYCRITDSYIWTIDRPDWCPLKPLPEKYDIEAERNKPHDIDCDWEFESGYNACIEEILGE